MKEKKLKAERREAKKKRKVSKTSGTLARQVRRGQISRGYRGDIKKLI
jgi:hypothetical protein